MNVALDGLVFENDVRRGIRRVFTEVLSRTASQVDYTLWLRAPAVGTLPAGVRVARDLARWYPERSDLVNRVAGKWRRSARSRAKVQAAVANADVHHSTFFTPRPSTRSAHVVSVYDMIPERLFGCSGGDAWAQNIAEKRAAIRSADLCLAISHATAADLVRFYPEVAKRVRVVPLGADHLAVEPAEPAASSDEPFVLFVGDRNGYKNFHVVLDAIGCPQWPAGVRLVVVGPRFLEHESDLVRALGLTDRVQVLGRVPNAELAGLYRRAGCFVYPSLLEGFGLPLLEAAANGCPVVCSDTPVFHEVAGDAALFFDPRLYERLADAIVEVFDPAVRARLIPLGHENARRFRWEDTAAGYLAVYAEAAAMARERRALA